jgi:hypothetical protein
VRSTTQPKSPARADGDPWGGRKGVAGSRAQGCRARSRAAGPERGVKAATRTSHGRSPKTTSAPRHPHSPWATDPVRPASAKGRRSGRLAHISTHTLCSRLDPANSGCDTGGQRGVGPPRTLGASSGPARPLFRRTVAGQRATASRPSCVKSSNRAGQTTLLPPPVAAENAVVETATWNGSAQAGYGVGMERILTVGHTQPGGSVEVRLSALPDVISVSASAARRSTNLHQRLTHGLLRFPLGEAAETRRPRW